ncbi:hypothetical protein HW132_02120 [Brasilonema sp. CT11]|nr:hypothetical protein [Brasilonema sp. CT11]
MSIYQDYSELIDFFGLETFDKFDVETLAILSPDALFRLQNLVMQAIAKRVKGK